MAPLLDSLPGAASLLALLLSPWILVPTLLPCLALALFCLYDELRRPRNLPPFPGSRPLPILGHKLAMPTQRSWLWFREMNEKHGPIITVMEGRTPRIVIGDPRIAIDLLDKRSAKYSSRPRFVLAGEILLGGRGMVHAPHGPVWRAQRKVFHMAMMPRAADEYISIMESEGRVLVHNIASNISSGLSETEWYEEIYRYTASLIVAIAYGRRVTNTRTDPAYLRLQQQLGFFIKVKVPGASWFETLPWLARLPGWMVPLKATALRYRAISRANAKELVDEVRRKTAKGTCPPCFARELLELRPELGWEQLGLDDIDFNGMPVSLFGAGIDTTSSILQSLILVMLHFPRVQKKVHEEFDRVVGHGRSPRYEDREDLKYAEAVVKETMRWRPVAVLGGTPHASTEDDWYEHDGKLYFIPAGSTVQGNMWSIHMNKDVYEDPETFNPDRFMDGREYPSTGNLGHSSFGWGRRVCPGMHFAQRSLFLTGSRLMWAFNITPPVDPATKQPVLPDASMETGYKPTFNTRPFPFRACFQIRSEEIGRTIEQEAAEAKDALKVFEEDQELKSGLKTA